MPDPENRVSRIHHVFVLFLLALGAAFGFTGCSSVPDDPTKTGSATPSDLPAEFTSRIDSTFRKKVAFLDEDEIEAYLAKVSNRLFSPARDSARLELVSAAGLGLEPSVWAVPGRTIFFDVRVLRALRFENEIAAAIAFARHRSDGAGFRDRMVDESGKADPRIELVWQFDEVDDHRAIEATVDRLYQAGYDPRGLVSYFDRIPTKGASTESLREGLKEKARRAISFYAPLMNPIVRTEDFYRMRKRLERL